MPTVTDARRLFAKEEDPLQNQDLNMTIDDDNNKKEDTSTV